MIQSENNSSKKIKENKYKILRMSLLLGQDVDKEDTINNFEDAAREIDSMNNETYLQELESKFYETQTLEEESKKLTDLVDYIAGRISQRESLLSDFINVTGRNLTGLGEIKYESKLSEYQERLKYINEYLDNTKKIEEETEELSKLNEKLMQEEKEKANNETKNSDLEQLLLKKFMNVATNKIDTSSLTEENIDDKIDSLNLEIEESKKSLDIFAKSFETLKNAGISYEDEVEYKSYVAGARDIYYDYKEVGYLLNIYKLLLTNETEYTKVYNKRESINNILNDRLELRENLAIKEEDCLKDIYSILLEQTKIVEGEKENIDNIANLTAKISYITERIEELKEANEKVEILSILKEYNIIDTYEEEKQEEYNEKEEEIELPSIDLPIPSQDVEEEQPEETEEEPEPKTEENDIETEIPINRPYKNNFIMGSHDPLGLDVDKCIEKATNVMKRVGKMLNIELPEEQPKKEEIEKPEEPKQPEIPVQPIPEVKVEVPKQEEISPFFSQQAENIEPQTSVEESNVKKVLPEADSFWGKQDLNETDEDPESFPNLTTSNDDFFANNMDNFEFPNLDEFK